MRPLAARRCGGTGNASLTTGGIVVLETRCGDFDTSVRTVLDLHVEEPEVQEAGRRKDENKEAELTKHEQCY